jgi:hypothetical protein
MPSRTSGEMDQTMASSHQPQFTDVVRHPILRVDLVELLRFYQSRYPGAMYSGCGGGYLFVASEDPVRGAFRIKVRIRQT